MLFAQKGNRVKPISDTEAQKFLSLGYNITDHNGDVVYEAIPSDVSSLRSAFAKHITQIAELRSQLTTVNAKLAETVSELEATRQELAVLKTTESAAVEEKPKRTRKKSTPKSDE